MICRQMIINIYCYNCNQQQLDYIEMWWTQPNHFVYNPYLLNCYQYVPCPIYTYQHVQTYETISSFVQNQQSQKIPQKSYRETPEEIEQKPIKRVVIHKRRRVQKSRFIHKKDKEDNFERKKQKKDRNLPSNICRYFVNYLYNHPSPQNILKTDKTFETEKLIKSSIQRAKNHIKPNQTYIRPGIIQQMCRTDLLGSKESHIFRILFQRFINTQFRMLISTFKKLTKKQKISYFKLGRKFVKYFTGHR